MKALRSLLNTPSNRRDMLDKAPGYGADALIIDVEDSCPIEQKDLGRRNAREYTEQFHQRGLITYVRVNSVATGMVAEDLDAIAVDGLAGVQLPKVETADEIRTVDRLLSDLESSRALPAGGIELFVSLESASAVQFAYDIVTAAPRVGSVLVGIAENGDLQHDLGYTTSVEETEVLYVRSRVLLAARAAHLENPIDGVYVDYRNSEGLRVSAEHARRLGYRGKKAIHPSQVAVINRVFTPSQRELDYYRRVLSTLDEALADGRGTAVLDGKMIDYAMAATARRVIGWAEAQHRD